MTRGHLDLSAVSIVLPFIQCHASGILQYIALFAWLLSLGGRHLKFLHVFSWLDSSFLLEWIITQCLDAPEFIYPLTYFIPFHSLNTL